MTCIPFIARDKPSNIATRWNLRSNCSEVCGEKCNRKVMHDDANVD
jgi:hypothetical protein